MFLFSTSYVLGGTCVYNNGGCDHVCLNRLNPSGQVCLCEEGFELSEDGKTCTSRTCEKELFVSFVHILLISKTLDSTNLMCAHNEKLRQGN